MKKNLFATLLAFLTLLTGSRAFAQFNWVNWSYPTTHTATASVGSGTITLTASGTNNSAIATTDIPIQYQTGFPYTQLAGDSAAAQSTYTSNFVMELDFTGFSTTAGLTLAIGNVADFGFSGYVMSAFNASNQPISLTNFSQLGNYDYQWDAAHGGYLFNDDLSLNPTTGNLSVTQVAGQDNLNSDMLILSLPAGVSSIFLQERVTSEAIGDTINFMAAPVPEPAPTVLLVLAGLTGFCCLRRRAKCAESPLR